MGKGPKKYGKIAMASRIAAMKEIGWEVGGNPQADWQDCLHTLLNTCEKATYAGLSFFFRVQTLTPQMIQRDVSIFGIQHPKLKKTWARRKQGRPQGKLLIYSKKTGTKYKTLYARMRKAMANGYSREDAMNVACSPKVKKIKRKVCDPKTMTKVERRKYLVRMAKKQGIWICAGKRKSKSAKLKQIRAVEPDYFTPEITSLLS